MLIISFLNKPVRKLKIVQTPTLDQDIQHVPTNDSSQHNASKYRKYCVLGLHRCNYLKHLLFQTNESFIKSGKFFFTLFLTENEFKLSFDKLNCTFLKFWINLKINCTHTNTYIYIFFFSSDLCIKFIKTINLKQCGHFLRDRTSCFEHANLFCSLHSKICLILLVLFKQALNQEEQSQKTQTSCAMICFCLQSYISYMVI